VPEAAGVPVQNCLLGLATALFIYCPVCVFQSQAADWAVTAALALLYKEQTQDVSAALLPAALA
jgi:hypothetical protein